MQNKREKERHIASAHRYVRIATCKPSTVPVIEGFQDYGGASESQSTPRRNHGKGLQIADPPPQQAWLQVRRYRHGPVELLREERLGWEGRLGRPERRWSPTAVGKSLQLAPSRWSCGLPAWSTDHRGSHCRERVHLRIVRLDRFDCRVSLRLPARPRSPASHNCSVP
eukprot:scaffold5816_cov267-Pinguiococcus_pyrenoidosus.AAC.7